MMNSVLIDLHYLPSIEYFTCISRFDRIILEQEEHFVKQSYRNRCHILTANKTDRLSIPVVGGNKNIPIKEIKIDYSQKWLNNHWRAIQSAYGNAPFFEFFADYFHEEFEKKEKFLFDLNFNLLRICLKLLQIDKPIELTNSYIKHVGAGIEDMRSVIHPKKSYEMNGFYQPKAYLQLFGVGFAANLSIIDLIFCEGPNAKNIMLSSMMK